MSTSSKTKPVNIGERLSLWSDFISISSGIPKPVLPAWIAIFTIPHPLKYWGLSRLLIFNLLLINYRLFQGLVNNEYLNLLLRLQFPPSHFHLSYQPLFYGNISPVLNTLKEPSCAFCSISTSGNEFLTITIFNSKARCWNTSFSLWKSYCSVRLCL